MSVSLKNHVSEAFFQYYTWKLQSYVLIGSMLLTNYTSKHILIRDKKNSRKMKPEVNTKK